MGAHVWQYHPMVNLNSSAMDHFVLDFPLQSPYDLVTNRATSLLYISVHPIENLGKFGLAHIGNAVILD